MSTHSNHGSNTPNIGGSVDNRPRHSSNRYKVRHAVRTTIIAVVIALLAFVGTAAGATWLNVNSTIESLAIDYIHQDDEGEDESVVDPNAGQAVSFLVMGQDTRAGANADLAGDADGDGDSTRADTTMIVQIAADRSWVNVVSIPRDTLVDVPSCQTSNGTIPAQYGVMFNSIFSTAYDYGGNVASAASCTVDAVNSLTGMHIQNFIIADFEGFKDIIDSLGGVDICLSQDTEDVNTDMDLKKGLNHLDGTEAMQFARMRHGTGTDGSDIMRTTRQQYLIKRILVEAQQKDLFTNSSELYQMAMSALRSLSISKGLASASTLVGLVMSLKNLDTSHIYAQTAPVMAAPSDPNRVVFAPSADDVWEKLDNAEPLGNTASSDDSATDTATADATDSATADATDGTDASASPSTSPTISIDPKTGLYTDEYGNLRDPDTGGIVDTETYIGYIKDPNTGQYIGYAGKYVDSTYCPTMAEE